MVSGKCSARTARCERRTVKLNSFAVHPPKLIHPGRKTLTHHLPPHPPIRIPWDTSETHRAPAPSTIDGIQNAPDFLSCSRLGDREDVCRVLAFCRSAKRLKTYQQPTCMTAFRRLMPWPTDSYRSGAVVRKVITNLARDQWFKLQGGVARTYDRNVLPNWKDDRGS